MQLRCYLGAAIYKPEDILLLEDIAFEGLINAHSFKDGSDEYNYQPWNPKKGTFDADTLRVQAGVNVFENFLGVNATQYRACDLGFNMFSGSLYASDGNLVRSNTGHLGHLDDINHWEAINGYQVYNAGAPLQTISGKSSV